MDIMTRPIEQVEYFDLILQTDNNAITSLELIKYLSNLESLVKSVNHTLNKQYCIGYDQIQLNVIALEKGSFKIPTYFKKVVNSPYTVALFGVIVGKLFSSDNQPIIYNINDSTVEIHQDVIMSNHETAKAMSGIAKVTLESKGIKEMVISYETLENTREKLIVDNTYLKGLIFEDIDEPEKQSNILPRATLTIISPVLEAEEAMWRFRMIDKKLSAKMTDSSFLELMKAKEIAFGYGDVIVADLETVITIKRDGTPDVKHYIRKVHEYPQYKNRTLSPNLFDN